MLLEATFLTGEVELLDLDIICFFRSLLAFERLFSVDLALYEDFCTEPLFLSWLATVGFFLVKTGLLCLRELDLDAGVLERFFATEEVLVGCFLSATFWVRADELYFWVFEVALVLAVAF